MVSAGAAVLPRFATSLIGSEASAIEWIRFVVGCPVLLADRSASHRDRQTYATPQTQGHSRRDGSFSK